MNFLYFVDNLELAAIKVDHKEGRISSKQADVGVLDPLDGGDPHRGSLGGALEDQGVDGLQFLVERDSKDLGVALLHVVMGPASGEEDVLISGRLKAENGALYRKSQQKSKNEEKHNFLIFCFLRHFWLERP